MKNRFFIRSIAISMMAVILFSDISVYASEVVMEEVVEENEKNLEEAPEAEELENEELGMKEPETEVQEEKLKVEISEEELEMKEQESIQQENKEQLTDNQEVEYLENEETGNEDSKAEETPAGEDEKEEQWDDKNIKSGIQKNGNDYYLYDESGTLLKGYVKYQNEKYYTDKNGVLQSGWIKIDSEWHYFQDSELFFEVEYKTEDGYLYILINGNVSYFTKKTTLLKNKWQTHNGIRYYFDENGFAVKGWFQDGNDWYYADENGSMSNTVREIAGKTYYFDSSYHLSSGWKKVDGVYRYFNVHENHEECYELTMEGESGWITLEDGRRTYIGTSAGKIIGWKTIDGYRYHFDKDGFVDTGMFQEGRYSYYAETIKTATDQSPVGNVVKGVRRIGEKIYGFHQSQYYCLTGWQTIAGQRYYFQNDCSAVIGWYQDGECWYYAREDGSMAKGPTVIDEKTYYFDSNYRLGTGWKRVENAWRFFNNAENHLDCYEIFYNEENGWCTFDDESRRYLNNKGTLLTGWQTIAKQKYYFDSFGVVQLGWFQSGNDWYFADADGKVQKGLLKIESDDTIKNYYFDSSYRLKTGWYTIDGVRYHFRNAENPEECSADYIGNVNKGWFTFGDNICYFNSSLKAVTGWQTINNQRYYFDPTGIMKVGWFQVGNDYFYADSGGAVAKGLVELPYGEEEEVKLYFFDNNYRLKTGWQTINGRQYFFENAIEPENCYATNVKTKIESGWIQLENGQISYVNSKGTIVKGWQTIDKQRYYFDTNGILQTGWFTVGKNRYYAEPLGETEQTINAGTVCKGRKVIDGKTYGFHLSNYYMLKGWQTIGGERYYFESDGTALTGWFVLKGKTYYADEETHVVVKGVQEIDGETYVFHTSQYYKMTGFQTYKGKRYFLQKDGTAKTGWFMAGTDLYYGEPQTTAEGILKGTLATGAKEIDGETYFFHNSSNYRLTGWQSYNGQKFYLDEDGTARTGWFVMQGKSYYGEPMTIEGGSLKGSLAKGICMINGETYVFHVRNYNRLTGWQTIGTRKYYLQANGIAKSGWFNQNGYWYYGTENGSEYMPKGTMEKSMRKIDVQENGKTVEHTYYFDTNYRLSSGWKTINRIRYYFDSNSNPQKCCLLFSGSISKGWFTFEDGAKCYFNGKGDALTGWQMLNGKKYYFDKKGIMQTGWCIIEGKEYFFNSEGIYVPMTVPTITSAKSAFYKTADVKWKEILGVETYILEYSTSKSFSQWTTNTFIVSDSSVNELRLENLLEGQTYYFRMRYTTWSSSEEKSEIYTSPYSAAVSCIIHGEVEATTTSAKITECQIISANHSEGIVLRIQATMDERLKSADDWYYILEIESYGNEIEQEMPIGIVEKVFEIDTLVDRKQSEVYRTVMNKFAIAILTEDGTYQLVSEPVSISNPEAMAENMEPILVPESKKGLQGIDCKDALYTNSKNTLFNLDLAEIVGTGPDDGYVAYEYKGKTYYFSDCNNYIGTFKELAEGYEQYIQDEDTGERNKVCITLNLLLSYKSKNNYLIDSAARTKGHKYYTLNVREEEARETFEALFLYLGKIFGQDDCYVTHWVLGNEVNSSNAWNYKGSLSFDDYMKVYTAAFRLLYNGVKASKTGNNVYISLDNGWTAAPDTYAGKSTLDTFAAYAQKENPYMLWNVAYHGYSYPMTRCDFWNDKSNTTNGLSTKYISMKNIYVLTDYVAVLEKKYDKPEGSIRVILSEQGYNAGKGHYAQAEALARGYYMAEFNDRIDAFIIRAIIDDWDEINGGLYFGLQNVYQEKRTSFYTYEFMDSNIEKFAKQEPSDIASSVNWHKVEDAQKILGETDWEMIIPNFSRSKLAEMR